MLADGNIRIMEELMAKYLANELNANERADFESKLIQNAQLSLDLEDHTNLLDLTCNETKPAFDTSAAWNKVKDRTQETKVVPIGRKFSYLKIAAMLIILVIASYFIIKQTNEPESVGVELASTTNQIKEFTLPDGSVVKLNANAKITLAKRFGDNNRNIVLQGEGNFDIVRNENLPFIIEAGNSTVKVLGTSFNLSTEQQNGVELNVTEGLVEFSSSLSGVKEKVAKGESARLDDKGTLIVKKENQNTNYSGWWTRRLEYDETPLSEVFEDLESTYWVRISYSKSIGTCKLNATFEGKPLNEIIELITETFEKVNLVSNKENQIKLEGKGCTN